MKNRLKDRIALVTEASSGIGEVPPLTLTEQGAKVAIVASRKASRKGCLDQLAGLGSAYAPGGSGVLNT